MKNEPCVFCESLSIENRERLVYQDDTVLVLVDVDWAVLGHTLVIFKRHEDNISDLTIEEYQAFSEIVWQTEQALRSILGDKRYVILKSGGQVSHLHFHIYPVDMNTDWKKLKKILDKKTKVTVSQEEKREFVQSLKDVLNE